MSKLWVVHGRTESGDEWELQFVGDSEPTQERINYVYAKEFPQEWAYLPEAIVLGISDVSNDGAYPVEGPTLESGEE